MSIQGEHPPITERFVVAPAWGRIQSGALTEGEVVECGSVVGHVRENGHKLPLVAHIRAAFVSWLVSEGERVGPGTPVAVLRAIEGDSHGSTSDRAGSRW